MHINAVITVYIFSRLVQDGSCLSGVDITKLHKNLYKVHPHVFPVLNYSAPITVNISFHLMSITSFETANQKLTSTGWLSVTWRDEYMTWNPSDYGGAKKIYPEADKVWRPAISVQNTMKDVKPVGMDYVTMIAGSDGSMAWFPVESFETFCRVDVTNFPYDFHKCRWEMTSWGDNDNDVILLPTTSTIDLDTFVGNVEWDLVSSKAYRQLRGTNATPLTYVVYEAVLRRRASLYIITILVPVLVLAVVNVFVFTIPSETGMSNFKKGH